MDNGRKKNRKTDRVMVITTCVLAAMLIAGMATLYIRSKTEDHYKTSGTGNAEISCEGINKLEVGTWDGSITVTRSDSDKITLKETLPDGREPENEAKLFYQLVGTKLEIKPSVSWVYNRLFGYSPEKDLVIAVPDNAVGNIVISVKGADISARGITGGKFTASAADGTVDVRDVNMDRISLSSASGGVAADDLTCGELLVKASECAAAVSGTLADMLKAEAYKGSVEIDMLNTPSAAQLDAADGSISLNLPDGRFSTELKLLNGAEITYAGVIGAADNAPYNGGDSRFKITANRSEIILSANVG